MMVVGVTHNFSNSCCATEQRGFSFCYFSFKPQVSELLAAGKEHTERARDENEIESKRAGKPR